MTDDFNIERCRYHEAEMREQKKRTARIEGALFTTNGEPGLIESVRAITRTLRLHSWALLLLLFLQLEQPVHRVVVALLKELTKVP